MANHNDFDDFFGDDDGPPVTDTRADGRLYRVPLARLAPNLVNPRVDFGTEDDLIDFGKSLARRQNQPCPVVSRSAYLKLWPDHAKQIGDVDYVLVSGERRYRGATIVGLATLDCVVNDDFATDRKTFMEAVVSENVDRQNFDPVEEAYAVQALAAEFGSNRAVAQHFERADGWVTQRILLTHLAPEVQALVRQKTIPLEAARSLGKLARDKQLDAAEQLAWWRDEQENRAAASAARRADRRSAQPAVPVTVAMPAATPPAPAPVPAPGFTAVKPAEAIQEADQAPPEATPVAQYAEPRVPEARPAPQQPEQAAPAPAPADGGPRRFPYEDGRTAAQHLIVKMPPDELDKMLEMLLEHKMKVADSRH